jgi:hypothetical protein
LKTHGESGPESDFSDAIVAANPALLREETPFASKISG